MKSLKQELLDRGLLYQYNSEDLFELYDKWGQIFYSWFDPSADSLHLWNFIGFMTSIHIMRRWNKFIALTWGATWMIWDPGWKDVERNFLNEDVLDTNQKAISLQIIALLNNIKVFTKEDYKFDFVNNKDFYKSMWYLDFLREVWKYITVNVMISKDTVKRRIEDPTKSISYTEFSYMLLQWYDYSKLFIDSWVKLQIGGQDQWWNLLTWTEIIRKKYDEISYVFTWPLITDSNWKKFGKSEWNAIWLDKKKTSPYELYQYFINTSDEDLSRYLKMFTLLETEEIDKKLLRYKENPDLREGQKLLAYSIVEIIHWNYEAELVAKISNFIFDTNDRVWLLNSLSKEDLDIFQNVVSWFKYSGENLPELIVKSWFDKSKTEARNSISSWAIYINEKKVENFNIDLNKMFLNWDYLILRKSKKNISIIRL